MVNLEERLSEFVWEDNYIFCCLLNQVFIFYIYVDVYEDIFEVQEYDYILLVVVFLQM